MSRSIRVRPDLVLRVKLAVKHNGFLRQQDLVEEVGLASSTVRNFLNGKLVDYATFIELCQRLNLEWRDFAESGEIAELNRESEEAVIARYSTSEIEQTTPDTLDLAEREEVITKPNRQIEQSNTDLIEERIFRATEQLNRGGFSALVGIQALEEIAKDSSRYHWKIMEVLAAFVRNAPQRKEEARIPDDLQAALTVIGRRDSEKDPPNPRLDLSNTDIRGAVLTGANLQGAILSKANLQGAYLKDAKFQGADLKEANLQGAKLWGADLQNAKLWTANLKKAVLNGAELQGAILDNACLEMAYLWYVNLQEAKLRNTKLKGAILREADLQGATLDGADLKGAFLNGANLEGVFLDVANLEGANLSEAKNLKSLQLETAFGDSQTLLPDDVEAPARWQQSGELQLRSALT
jgi:uncharacterized protein YjbI with pentapeptide repeats/transcriptional regulator with XRE-family HTH domain